MSETPAFETLLERYATVMLRIGVNLQPGQNLILNTSAAPVEEVAPVMRVVARKAYELGARNVFPNWNDGELARTRLELAPEEALSDVPLWRINWLAEESARGSAFLTLDAPNPDQFSGIETARLVTSQRANAQATAPIAEAAMKMAHPWSGVAIATRAWATRIYPHLSEREAVAALWAYIFKATRVDQDDPIQAWHDHINQLELRTRSLNGARLTRLVYRAPGTDLTIELPAGHQWLGGGGASPQGHVFVPNLPTEEVFSAPLRHGVNGTVCGTMPLNYNGVMIEDIRLTLRAGRIESYSASSGEEMLKSLIETDEGSHYLGEVALVPCDSPVNTGTPVCNTLFDENASCHLAIGTAYPICIAGGDKLSPDELAARGLNSSRTHVDFMIGSPELDIDGETAGGERVPVLRRGLWAMRGS